MPALRQQLFRVKPVPRQKEDVETDLKRTIGLFSLTMVGVGSTIGTGIFFILSESVPVAGPAVIWSFIIAGIVAGLAVICYAELAGSVPASGSSYSYAYATLGEDRKSVVKGRGVDSGRPAGHSKQNARTERST